MDNHNTDLQHFSVNEQDSASIVQRLQQGADAAPASATRTLPDEGIDLRAAVEEFESHLIRQALQKTGGNKNKAAQLLRMNRTTLVEMVKRKRLNVA